MSSSAVRFAAVAVVLAGVGGAVVLLGGSKTEPKASPSAAPTLTAPTPGGCLMPPAKREPLPSWYPTDLPLPKGSYTMEVLAPSGSTQRAIFVVPGTLRDFVVHALEVWPKQGWLLGRGETEPGEAEDQFAKPKEDRYGAFRARSIFCDDSVTWVLIVVGKRQVTASPSGTASL